MIFSTAQDCRTQSCRVQSFAYVELPLFWLSHVNLGTGATVERNPSSTWRHPDEKTEPPVAIGHEKSRESTAQTISRFSFARVPPQQNLIHTQAQDRSPWSQRIHIRSHGHLRSPSRPRNHPFAAVSPLPAQAHFLRAVLDRDAPRLPTKRCRLCARNQDECARSKARLCRPLSGAILAGPSSPMLAMVRTGRPEGRR